MAAPFRLRAGDPAPVQQSGTTCGSACLIVARMLLDPAFADWIRLGAGRGWDPGGDRPGETETERFAAYERVVVARTNGLVGAGGRLQPPWPRALGTPPWGARRELELGGARPGARYAVGWCRLGGRATLEAAYAALLRRARPGRPALLYVGNRWLPRHVVLVVPAAGREGLEVYEPSAGQVVDMPRDAFVSRRLGVGGWDVPWAAVWDLSRA
ncbi:MAG TPA: hypothetical protein VFJ94_04100 [Intrasporangium sp.]|uniref:hypothetical protein n=1 Tax=Intrasporangium sp. TaxID=1925024 RepID=UPI002D7A2EAE|nr:hypothetical protein [Intrasporangium sp.]HET7397686.1 hypothetical protein [Intrasporangium sp.]